MDIATIDRTTLQRYMVAITKWHDLLNNTLSETNLTNMASSSSVLVDNREPYSLNSIIDQAVNEAVSATINIIAPMIAQTLKQSELAVKEARVAAANTTGCTDVGIGPLFNDSLWIKRQHVIDDISRYKRLIGEKFLGIPNFDFKSKEQRETIIELATGVNNIVAVIRTSGGKNLCYLFPILLEVAKQKELGTLTFSKCTIVIVPLVSIAASCYRHIEETMKKFVSVRIWGSKVAAKNIPATNEDVKFYSASDNAEVPQVLIVVIESVSTASFLNFIQMVTNTNRLRSIVIDEGHFFLWDHFRPSYQILPTVCALAKCKVCVLSATLPPAESHLLLERMNLRNSTRTIRGPPNRPELQFIVEKAIDEKSIKNIVEKIILEEKQEHKDEPCKILVFVNTVSDAELMASHLRLTFGAEDVLTYHSKLMVGHKGSSGEYQSSRDLQLETMQKFLKHKDFLTIVCTSGLATGVDDPHIRLVIICGPMYDYKTMFQAFSRAGRDGKPCKAVAIDCQQLSQKFFRYCEEELARGNADGDTKRRELQAMQSLWNRIFLQQNHNFCIRNLLNSFIIGDTFSGEDCQSDPRNIPCTSCINKQTLLYSHETKSTNVLFADAAVEEGSLIMSTSSILTSQELILTPHYSETGTSRSFTELLPETSMDDYSSYNISPDASFQRNNKRPVNEMSSSISTADSFGNYCEMNYKATEESQSKRLKVTPNDDASFALHSEIEYSTSCIKATIQSEELDKIVLMFRMISEKLQKKHCYMCFCCNITTGCTGNMNQCMTKGIRVLWFRGNFQYLCFGGLGMPISSHNKNGPKECCSDGTSNHLKAKIKTIQGFCCKCTLPLKRHEKTANGEPNLGMNCNIMSKTDGEFVYGIANFYLLGIIRNLPIASEAQQEIEQTCGGRDCLRRELILPIVTGCYKRTIRSDSF
jgi:superfamily II DNA helicase RecQ